MQHKLPVLTTGHFYYQVAIHPLLPACVCVCVSGNRTDAVHLALEWQSSSLSPKCPGEPLAFGQH